MQEPMIKNIDVYVQKEREKKTNVFTYFGSLTLTLNLA